MGRVGSGGASAVMESFFALLQQNGPRPLLLDHPGAAAHRDRHMDRTNLPPPPQTNPTRPIDPHRVRDHHEHRRHTGGVTTTCSDPCKENNANAGFGAAGRQRCSARQRIPRCPWVEGASRSTPPTGSFEAVPAAVSRILGFALGVVLSAIGGLGGIALIVLSIESAGGWAFLLVPATLLVGGIMLALGSKLIAHATDK